ncbi:tRNA(Ile)-lysidine synthase [Rhodospirillaceae bacterium LM-1]|nr:tRNA(Ile)-lysidine synthase [Rhodospirillaceae bacterium LM-1]
MIDVSSFGQRMQRLGPFESRPHLAVAVSGGSDSLALTLLTQEWARARDGWVTALIVDHALRPDSRSEAMQVKRWLKRQGVSTRILTWQGEKPANGRMAAARNARYALLEDECEKMGILHLLLAHQMEDQAETCLMRLARGSGAEGMAAMSPLAYARHVRLLRPLLGATRQSLKDYLESRDQDWISDPSNDNPSFERVRVRQSLPQLARIGLSAQALAASADKFQRLKRYLEDEAAILLAKHVSLAVAGYAWLEPAFLDEPLEPQRWSLARLLACLGGEGYLPAAHQVEKLCLAMADKSWRGATLGGCRLLRHQGRILVTREAQACQAPLRLVSGQGGLWDGRYQFRCSVGKGRGLTLGALGSQGAQQLARLAPELKTNAGVPFPAWASLPAIRDARGVSALPGLGYKRSNRSLEPLTELIFLPRRALTGSSLLLS